MTSSVVADAWGAESGYTWISPIRPLGDTRGAATAPTSGVARAADRISNRRGLAAAVPFGDQRQGPVETRSETLREHVEGVPGAGVGRIIAGIARVQPQRKGGNEQSDHHRQRAQRERPWPRHHRLAPTPPHRAGGRGRPSVGAGRAPARGDGAGARWSDASRAGGADDAGAEERDRSAGSRVSDADAGVDAEHGESRRGWRTRT